MQFANVISARELCNMMAVSTDFDTDDEAWLSVVDQGINHIHLERLSDFAPVRFLCDSTCTYTSWTSRTSRGHDKVAFFAVYRWSSCQRRSTVECLSSWWWTGYFSCEFLWTKFVVLSIINCECSFDPSSFTTITNHSSTNTNHNYFQHVSCQYRTCTFRSMEFDDPTNHFRPTSQPNVDRL